MQTDQLIEAKITNHINVNEELGIRASIFYSLCNYCGIFLPSMYLFAPLQIQYQLILTFEYHSRYLESALSIDILFIHLIDLQF